MLTEDREHTVRRCSGFPAKEIRAVVFDLDNTLLRSTNGARHGLLVAAHLIASELRKKGLSYSERDLLTRLRWIDREMLGRKFLYNRDVWWKTLLEELSLGTRVPWVRAVTRKYWNAYASNSPPFQDAESTLLRVQKMGLKIGLVSDTDGTPGMKRKRIRRVPFRNLFEAIVVAGEDTPRVKPGHESFRMIARRLRVQPGSCIYVADNPRTDIVGARAVGMTTVIVKRRGNKAGKPDYRIPNLKSLLKLITTMRRPR